MSKPNLNKRQSISSSQSAISSSNEPPISFEQYLTMAQDSTAHEYQSEKSNQRKSQQVSSKYGIHVQRNKTNKNANNFIELNKQKLDKRQDHVLTPQNSQSSWRNLIKGVLDLQRGKIPLLLAVEAGNQSMVRELLSSQTTEQLTVSDIFQISIFFFTNLNSRRKTEVRKIN